MPATSESQAKTARVALAVKRGKQRLADIEPQGFRTAVRSMLSMSDTALQDFTRTQSRSRIALAQRSD